MQDGMLEMVRRWYKKNVLKHFAKYQNCAEQLEFQDLKFTFGEQDAFELPKTFGKLESIC